MQINIFIYLFLALSSLSTISDADEVKARSAPDLALKKLMEGNQRYLKDNLEHPHRTPERREAISSNQNPFAIVLGCSDSRVSPEIIFDQGLGDIFVVRVAGNVVGPIELSSIEYSAEQLGSSIILVLGHENCGAVSAVLANKIHDIEPIAEKIQFAMKNYSKPAKTPLEAAIKANVRAVVAQLSQTKPIADLIKAKKIGVVGGYYNLSTGEVELCCDL